MKHLVFSLPIEIQDKIFNLYYREKYNEVVKEYTYSRQRLNIFYKYLKYTKLNYLNSLKRSLYLMKRIIND